MKNKILEIKIFLDEFNNRLENLGEKKEWIYLEGYRNYLNWNIVIKKKKFENNNLLCNMMRCGIFVIGILE